MSNTASANQTESSPSQMISRFDSYLNLKTLKDKATLTLGSQAVGLY